VANPSKAHQQLKWQPNVSFEELIRMMVEADLKRVVEEMR
jgi:GDPmannose 4,6-dehydratase